MQPPTPTEVRAVRLGLGLSQAEAAAIVHHKLRAWQKWEGGESAMHPALWELFRIKTGLQGSTEPGPHVPPAG